MTDNPMPVVGLFRCDGYGGGAEWTDWALRSDTTATSKVIELAQVAGMHPSHFLAGLMEQALADIVAEQSDEPDARNQGGRA